MKITLPFLVACATTLASASCTISGPGMGVNGGLGLGVQFVKKDLAPGDTVGFSISFLDQRKPGETDSYAIFVRSSPVGVVVTLDTQDLSVGQSSQGKVVVQPGLPAGQYKVEFVAIPKPSAVGQSGPTLLATEVLNVR